MSVANSDTLNRDFTELGEDSEMTKLNELKKEWLKRPDVKAEYDALADEFSVAESLIRSRVQDDVTGEEIFRKITDSK